MSAVAQRSSQATRARLLEAAAVEFAAHGLAGARVDRIAQAARANKRLIYVYFGSKELLFDAVVVSSLRELIETVPFTPTDLPGYAGALFDHLSTHPQLMRLAIWRNLERPEVVDAERDSYAEKVDALAAAQARGALEAAFRPTDVLALVLGLVSSWLLVSAALRELDGDLPLGGRRLAEQRAATVAAVQRLTERVV